MLPVLIVEDDAALREALTDTLTLGGHPVLVAPDAESALQILARERVGLVLTDVQMPGMDGHALLKRVRADHPWVPVVLMTAYGVIERAVDAMKDGAADYLPKPFEPDALLAKVARYLARTGGDEEEDLVADDPAMLAALDLARRVAETDATVFITGESGAGKEVVARFIHRASPRAGGPYVAVNCAAIPENLVEATLFGHEKGAFTGATQAHAGKFEQAQGGTLLLDEVSELPLGLQAKLLRVLQEREVERVGGARVVPLDVRVLATSNRDVAKAVREGRFREDLYFRLNVMPLTVPPLRDRPRDLLPLARRLLRKYARRFGKPAPVLTPEAARSLTGYGWPGNIRELENVLQRALILAGADGIGPQHLHLPEAPSNAAAEDMKSRERAHILKTLAATGGSRREAAKRLGLSERTLRYKLAQYRTAGEDLAD